MEGYKSNLTGCPILDKKGISAGNVKKGGKYCLNCPYPECVLKERDSKRIGKDSFRGSKEIFVICKKCGACETLLVTKGKLQPTQHWQQRGAKIFHVIDCGEAK